MIQILCALFLALLTRAEIYTLDQFRLPLLTLVEKHRFVFSDLETDVRLDHALIEFDLKFNV